MFYVVVAGKDGVSRFLQVDYSSSIQAMPIPWHLIFNKKAAAFW
uniref:Uncharacterized protein n=1 Tax=Marseillevirus LCMAC202 TaxID=2506606 RepID=A0A481Z0G1_9VIRU|nr:MAG: hypothetical protein LCMAC202_06360 [Marseillevirus LCMAC202]